MNKTLSLCMLLVAALLLCASVPAVRAAEPTMTIRPNLVAIGTNFNGATVDITGTVPEGASAVIRLLGEPSKAAFKVKGKAFGLLWMNLRTVELENVSDVFLVGTDGAGKIDWEHSDLGFQSIKGETDDLIFNEFIKLMERDGFYEIEKGVVHYKADENGQRPFSASLSIPSAMHQGIYTVEVLAIQDGKVVGRTTQELHTKLTGLPAMLSEFAFDHSLLYGIAAVIIAILAGLGMSLLFREHGGAH
ncbi:MAG: TIGR02186 family protein [Desulfovibrio sp.]|uniref:TIGR02186 family protein n=1 Tax=Desulfovibrio sp. 7SRBS1 TaxID=3378064 RepID=UPI003B424D97